MIFEKYLFWLILIQSFIHQKFGPFKKSKSIHLEQDFVLSVKLKSLLCLGSESFHKEGFEKTLDPFSSYPICTTVSVHHKVSSRSSSSSRHLQSIHHLPSEVVFHYRCLPSKVIFHQTLYCIKCRFPSNFVLHQKSSSFNGLLPLKVFFQQMSSSIKIWRLSKIVFHQRSSSIKSCLPLKVIFHPRSSSIKGRLISKVVFHKRLSSIKGCLI